MCNTFRSAIVSVILGISASLPAAFSEPVAFKNEEAGYSLSVPVGWHQVPDSVLQSVFSLMLKDGNDLVFDAAFEPDGSPHPLAYPYVLIQIMSYEKTGQIKSPSPSQMKLAIKAFTGQDIVKELDSRAQPEVVGMLKNSDLSSPTLDIQTGKYTCELMMEVEGIGKVRGHIAGHFGSKSAIQVMYYDRPENWDSRADVRNALISSFRFFPDFALVPTADEPERSIFSGAVRGAVIGGIGAMLIGGIFRNRKQQSA